MSVTSGFFNSINGDRRYNAEQMSSIFDGIINDGIFANIGTAFMVEAKSGNDITVGIGRAWFNSTWLYNDAILPLTADDSDILLNRYDAVVIEIDRSVAGRAGTIKIIKGTAASDALYPALAKTNEIHQYPLAYIYRPADSSEIKQANITNAVGTSSAPYITGILQVQNVDNLVAQWQAQFTDWNSEKQNEFVLWATTVQNEFEAWRMNQQNGFDTWKTKEQTDYETWRINEQAKYLAWIERVENEFITWNVTKQAEFEEWFEHIKGQLSEDAAGHLQEQIDNITAENLGAATPEYVDQQIALITETGIPKLMSYALPVVAEEDGQTVFNINLETFDVLTDTVIVQYGRTFLSPNRDFSIVGKTVVLNEGAPLGRTLDIYIFKNVPLGDDGNVSGQVIADETLSLDAMKTRYIVLTASGWSDIYPYEQTVEVEGITSNDSLMIIGAVHADGNTEAQDKAIDKAAGMLMYYEDGVNDGSVTFRAKKKPAIDITVITKGG